MVAVALGAAVAPRPLLKPVLIAGAACAVLPDLDAIGRLWSSGDLDFVGGHRGFTHSLAFAGLLGVACALVTFPFPRWTGSRLRFGIHIALVTAAHGVLDAFTTIGARSTPPQLLSPFSTTGYVSPWQPIQGPFTELFLVFLPLVGLTRLACRIRRIPWPRIRNDGVSRLDLSRREGRR